MMFSKRTLEFIPLLFVHGACRELMRSSPVINACFSGFITSVVLMILPAFSTPCLIATEGGRVTQLLAIKAVHDPWYKESYR